MTYSIVAREAASGFLGVAVQSHYFGVGRVVGWAEAGVGAVATQALPDVAYGPRGIALMRSGLGARESLERLLGEDPGREVRQVAMIDARGEAAVHTGSGCIAAAGHAVGTSVSAQANLVERPSVWETMLRAFESSAGEHLARRLLVSLEAAEAEGGDLRGRCSAAVLVVSGVRSDAPWKERLIDVRVDDHPDPLRELRRLLDASFAFDRLASTFASGILFRAVAPDDAELERALHELDAAQRVLEPNREPSFWQAVLLVKAGRVEEGRTKLRSACETNPRWADLVGRLVPAGIVAPEQARCLSERP